MPTQIKCSNCGRNFVAQILTVLDVGEKPELKEQFLRGQVNYAQCPDCGAGGLLLAPMIYHDLAKELLVTFVPPQLEMSADQREQLVGSLVQAAMSNVPADQRKGYFLRPKSVFTLESLYDMILEADGISKEMLQAQRARMELLSELLEAMEAQDDAVFDRVVEEHRETLDYTFFLLIADLIDARSEGEDPEATQVLASLRDKLLERVSPAMPTAVPADASYDELVEVLLQAGEGAALRDTVAMNRAHFDYGFFQALTQRIEAAQQSGDSESETRLSALRERTLREMDAQDKMVQEAQDQASLLIMQLAEAQDLRAAVREHLPEVTDLFLGLLGRYLQVVHNKGDEARVAKLQAVWEAVIEALEEKLPAEARVINRVLRAEYPDGTNKVLEANRGILNDALLESIDCYVEEIKTDQPELAEHLLKVRKQIVAKRTILRR
jgi:hypothetical protein